MTAVRTICWLLAIASVVLVVVRYDSLPDEFPLTRWTTVTKTPFLAVRVPLINLASLALIELLATNLRRLTPTMTSSERNLYLCLLAIIGAKTVIETFELVGLANLQTPALKYGLIVAVLAGLSAACYFFTRIEPARRQTLFHTDRKTHVLIGVLLAAILVFNLPLIWRRW